jgi:hypothetical protein
MQNCSNSGKPQMAIPSQARRDNSREGVETRRAAPKLRSFPEEGEGIVQTPNRRELQGMSRSGGESRRRYENPQGLNGP